MKTYQTIHDLLPSTRGDQKELARILDCDRITLSKYIHDVEGNYHAVVNGKLMTATLGKGKRKKPL